jgi:tripartite-type tricarboxylate transporter receptor subunit TctC
MGELLGRLVVIENRAGAGAAVGSEFVANAPADGDTLSLRRAALMPGIPVFAEAGAPEAALNFWSRLHTPANLPPALVSRPSETPNKALNVPDLRERRLQLDADAFPVSQPALVAQIKGGVARIAKGVKAAGIQPA